MSPKSRAARRQHLRRTRSAAEPEAATAPGCPPPAPAPCARHGPEAASPRSWSWCPGPAQLRRRRGGQKPLRMAADLAGNPRITALSVTDNAGGHARLSPDALGEALARARPRRDRPRRLPRPEPQRHAEPGLGLLARGLTHVLAHLRRLPGGGVRGPARARLRHRLRGPARACSASWAPSRPPRRATDGLPDPSGTASTWAARSTPSSASSASSCRSSSSSR